MCIECERLRATLSVVVSACERALELPAEHARLALRAALTVGLEALRPPAQQEWTAEEILKREG